MMATFGLLEGFLRAESNNKTNCLSLSSAETRARDEGVPLKVDCLEGKAGENRAGERAGKEGERLGWLPVWISGAGFFLKFF